MLHGQSTLELNTRRSVKMLSNDGNLPVHSSLKDGWRYSAVPEQVRRPKMDETMVPLQFCNPSISFLLQEEAVSKLYL